MVKKKSAPDMPLTFSKSAQKRIRVQMSEKFVALMEMLAEGKPTTHIAKTLKVSRVRVYQMKTSLRKVASIKPLWTDGLSTRAINVVNRTDITRKQKLKEYLQDGSIHWKDENLKLGKSTYVELINWSGAKPPIPLDLNISMATLNNAIKLVSDCGYKVTKARR